MRTIAEEIEIRLRESGGGSPLRVEGLRDLQWVLVDYGDIVIHVFLEERAASTTSSGSTGTCPGWSGSRWPGPAVPTTAPGDPAAALRRRPGGSVVTVPSVTVHRHVV